MKYYKMNHEVTKDDIQKFNFNNPKIGVIAYIENNEGKILLQQRGEKSRDEIGKFACVGGSLEISDKSYKEAIIREIKEEMGNDVVIEFFRTSDILHINNNDDDFLFLIFKCKYIKGKINIMEPKKCIGYKFFEYDEAINSDMVSEGCKFILKSI